MSLILWTLAIAVLTAVVCSLCGVFLVVKHESMIAEALSHAVLPGILIAFLVFQDRTSPWLIISAGLSGLLMVWVVETIRKTGLVDGDAALGIVFSALFSIGIICANLGLNRVHFDSHCIIDGNLSMAALRPLTIGGHDIAPYAFVLMATVLLLLIGFIATFYKELKLMMFDSALSQTFGFRPTMMHLIWLALVSITTVSAFEIAGSILVVALMIAPPATAFLLTRRLGVMLAISSTIGVISSVVGFWLGMGLDIAPTGPIASVAGMLFLLTVFLAPRQGILAKWRRRRSQRADLFQQLLLARLDSDDKNWVAHKKLVASVAWTDRQYRHALKVCQTRDWVDQSSMGFSITDKGRNYLIDLEARC
jgi:manganese/zinc/iron transport system permease protein